MESLGAASLVLAGVGQGVMAGEVKRERPQGVGHQ